MSLIARSSSSGENFEESARTPKGAILAGSLLFLVAFIPLIAVAQPDPVIRDCAVALRLIDSNDLAGLQQLFARSPYVPRSGCTLPTNNRQNYIDKVVNWPGAPNVSNTNAATLKFILDEEKSSKSLVAGDCLHFRDLESARVTLLEAQNGKNVSWPLDDANLLQVFTLLDQYVGLKKIIYKQDGVTLCSQWPEYIWLLVDSSYKGNSALQYLLSAHVFLPGQDLLGAYYPPGILYSTIFRNWSPDFIKSSTVQDAVDRGAMLFEDPVLKQELSMSTKEPYGNFRDYFVITQLPDGPKQLCKIEEKPGYWSAFLSRLDRDCAFGDEGLLKFLYDKTASGDGLMPTPLAEVDCAKAGRFYNLPMCIPRKAPAAQ
jgi:hypothetical protein